MSNEKELEKLRREIDALNATIKAALPVKLPSEEEANEWRNQQHQAAERRASAGALSTYTRDQLRAMERAVSPDDVQGIVRDNRGAPTGPKGIIPQQVSDVRLGGAAGPAGGGTGWMRETPIGPPPGVAQSDRLMDAQDRRDRAELIQREEAVRRAERQKR